MHLLISKSKACYLILTAQATEYFQQIRTGAIGTYLRKLILKYTDSECTIIV